MENIRHFRYIFGILGIMLFDEVAHAGGGRVFAKNGHSAFNSIKLVFSMKKILYLKNDSFIQFFKK
jgi:hypothetical protein